MRESLEISYHSAKYGQGRSEGTSSVAFELLIINCQIYYINLFIFNCLALNVNLFIFNLCDVKFLFSESHICRKQKRTAVYWRASLVSDFKLNRENDDLLSSRHKCFFWGTLCNNILKCGFLTKGIKLTRFIYFEALGAPQLWDPSV